MLGGINGFTWWLGSMYTDRLDQQGSWSLPQYPQEVLIFDFGGNEYLFQNRRRIVQWNVIITPSSGSKKRHREQLYSRIAKGALVDLALPKQTRSQPKLKQETL